MAYYDRLRQARKDMGMSQSDIADRLGVGKSTVSGYETGAREPSMAILVQIMGILNIDADFVFQDEVAPKRKTENLKAEEKELLNEYRALNSANQSLLLKTAHYLKDSEDLEVIVKKAKEWDARENRENWENPA